MNIDHTSILTGIPLIDAQHDRYIELVEQLFMLAQQTGTTRAIIEVEFGKVMDYAVEHLDAEEFLMQSEAYPYLAQHKAKHDEFRDWTDTFLAQMDEDVEPDEMIVQMTKWLIEWFCDQVQTHDMQLAKFLKKKQA